MVWWVVRGVVDGEGRIDDLACEGMWGGCDYERVNLRHLYYLVTTFVTTVQCP